MKQKFNILKHYKKPKLKLCKPDRKAIGYLSIVKNLNIKLVSNSLSEISFIIYSKLDDKTTPYYDLVKFSKLIFADDFGYFIITNVEIQIDENNVEFKTVTGLSAEFELTYSRLGYLDKVISLYNPLNALDKNTILGKFVKSNPLWKIGNIDTELWNVYRSYDESGSNWYEFLTTTVEDNCQCIFKFDNINRIVSVYTPEKYSKKTNILLSRKNLIVDLNIDEKSDEVFTAINCYGGGDLNISRVNPLGTNTIYNWEFFKTNEWMDEDTINAINLWESKFKNLQQRYISILADLRNSQIKLIGLQTELTELKNKLQSVETIISTKIAQGIATGQSYKDLVKEKNQYVDQIKYKNIEIESLKLNIETIKNSAISINKELAFENNFTESQLTTLNSITKIDDYQNDAFIKSSTMNEVEIQDQSQELYNHCLKILSKISQPRYYFKGKLVNFIFLKEFESFTNQLELGCIVKAQIKKGWFADLVLLSINLNFDDPTDFTIEFSNRQRLDNGIFEFDDIISKNSIASNKVNWDSAIWGQDVKSGQSDQIRQFIDGNLDAAKNALESAKGVGVTFDGSGLHLRKYIDNVLQGNEIWATGDMIALSSDNFNTPPRIAIGEFQLPNSLNSAFGVNAEFLAGYLVCGNNFVFENKDKKSNITQFRFDGDGAYLYNSKITIENDFSQIKLDPNDSSIFTISGRENRDSKWLPKIFMDTKGNANFVGKGTFEEGLIGGWVIKKDGIYSPFGDYIKNDGNIKFGILTLTPNSGTFNGNVYANNLLAGGNYGYVNNYHFLNDSLSGEKIGTNSLSGIKVITNTLPGAKILDNSISANKLEASYRDGVIQSIASVTVNVDKNSASINSLTEYVNSNFSKTNTSITQLSNSTNAQIKSLTSYVDSKYTQANTSITQLSNNTSAQIKSLTEYVDDEFDNANKSITEISQLANKTEASISLSASIGSRTIGSNVKALLQLVANPDSSSIYIKADAINLSGITTFVRPGDLKSGGTTQIDGSRIKTGTIDAARISTNYITSYFSNTGTLYIEKALRFQGNAFIDLPAQTTDNGLTNIRFNGKQMRFKAIVGINGIAGLALCLA